MACRWVQGSAIDSFGRGARRSPGANPEFPGERPPGKDGFIRHDAAGRLSCGGLPLLTWGNGLSLRPSALAKILAATPRSSFFSRSAAESDQMISRLPKAQLSLELIMGRKLPCLDLADCPLDLLLDLLAQFAEILGQPSRTSSYVSRG